MPYLHTYVRCTFLEFVLCLAPQTLPSQPMSCATTQSPTIEYILVLPHCANQMSVSLVGDIEQILDKALEVWRNNPSDMHETEFASMMACFMQEVLERADDELLLRMLGNQEKVVGCFVSHEARRYYASTVRRTAESLEHKCANTRTRNPLQKAQDRLWSIWNKANHNALDASQTTSK